MVISLLHNGKMYDGKMSIPCRYHVVMEINFLFRIEKKRKHILAHSSITHEIEEKYVNSRKSE
jgi:hypothetical protein